MQQKILENAFNASDTRKSIMNINYYSIMYSIVLLLLNFSIRSMQHVQDFEDKDWSRLTTETLKRGLAARLVAVVQPQMIDRKKHKRLSYQIRKIKQELKKRQRIEHQFRFAYDCHHLFQENAPAPLRTVDAEKPFSYFFYDFLSPVHKQRTIHYHKISRKP